MASIETLGPSQRYDQRYRAERRQALALLCLAYPFCLALAIGTRLLPAYWRSTGRTMATYRCVFREAKALAASFIPFAFR